MYVTLCKFMPVFMPSQVTTIFFQPPEKEHFHYTGVMKIYVNLCQFNAISIFLLSLQVIVLRFQCWYTGLLLK